MNPSIRPPVYYPNWVWILGATLLLIAVTWVVILVIAYRTSRIEPDTHIGSLNQLRRARYRRQLNQLAEQFEAGEFTGRDVHLALTAIIKSAGSERLRVNIEYLTVQQAQQKYPHWHELGAALRWCETPSFGSHEAYETYADNVYTREAVTHGMQLAREVIG